MEKKTRNIFKGWHFIGIGMDLLYYFTMLTSYYGKEEENQQRWLKQIWATIQAVMETTTPCHSPIKLIFYRFDPLGQYLLHHMLCIVHTDTFFSQTFKHIFIFLMFLHGEVDHGHLWREESKLICSPISCFLNSNKYLHIS